MITSIYTQASFKCAQSSRHTQRKAPITTILHFKINSTGMRMEPWVTITLFDDLDAHAHYWTHPRGLHCTHTHHYGTPLHT